MIQVYFRRTHLPSGQVYVAKFSECHVPGLSYLAFAGVERSCKEVIDKWNRQQPQEWFYEYLGANPSQKAVA